MNLFGVFVLFYVFHIEWFIHLLCRVAEHWFNSVWLERSSFKMMMMVTIREVYWMHGLFHNICVHYLI